MIEIEYEPTDDNLLVPNTWTVISEESGQRPLRAIRHSKRVTWNRLGTEGEPPPVNLDAISEPCTWVINEVDGTEHIVLPNGRKRQISDSEKAWGPTYAELVATASGSFMPAQQLDTPERVTRWSLGVAGTAMLVFASAYADGAYDPRLETRDFARAIRRFD